MITNDMFWRTVDGVKYRLSQITLEGLSGYLTDVSIHLPDLTDFVVHCPGSLSMRFITATNSYTFPISSTDFSTEQTGKLTIAILSTPTDFGLTFYSLFGTLPVIPGLGLFGLGEIGLMQFGSRMIDLEFPTIQLFYTETAGAAMTRTGFAPGRLT